MRTYCVVAATAAVLAGGISTQAAVLVNFNNSNVVTGDLATKFVQNGTAGAYTASVSGGLSGSGGVNPASSTQDTTTVYTAGGSSDFSVTGATFTLSMFVKVTNDTSGGNQTQVLGLGLVTASNQQFTSGGGANFAQVRFRSNGDNISNTIEQLQIQNTVGGTGSNLDQQIVNLTAGNWYKLTTILTNAGGGKVQFGGALENYGATGAAFVSTVATVPSNSYTNAVLTSDASVFPAFRGFTQGGAAVFDNFSVSGPNDVEIPEPASLGLLGLGGLALLMRRRK